MNSEFRQDLVSGDWVVIAPKRLNRPDQFKRKEKRIISPKKNCPFEDPQKSGHDKPSLVYPSFRKWLIQVVPNKYSVLAHGKVCPHNGLKGPYSIMDGIGVHDVVITKDHYKNFSHLDKKIAIELFKIFQKRYKMIIKEDCMKYFFAFHNWGPKAGASIFHPHYQILSLPIIPPDVSRSLDGSKKYFKEHKRCVHCDMIKFELKERKRIVYENKEAVVFTPFVAKEPFELRIFPKKHNPCFASSSDKLITGIVDVLQVVLKKLEKHLGDPDYNFFIHTAPIGNEKNHSYYHWHIEILPKFSIAAGFEIGTGIEITVVDPDEAARILRKV